MQDRGHFEERSSSSRKPSYFCAIRQNTRSEIRSRLSRLLNYSARLEYLNRVDARGWQRVRMSSEPEVAMARIAVPTGRGRVTCVSFGTAMTAEEHLESARP